MWFYLHMPFNFYLYKDAYVNFSLVGHPVIKDIDDRRGGDGFYMYKVLCFSIMRYNEQCEAGWKKPVRLLAKTSNDPPWLVSFGKRVYLTWSHHYDIFF